MRASVFALSLLVLTLGVGCQRGESDAPAPAPAVAPSPTAGSATAPTKPSPTPTPTPSPSPPAPPAAGEPAPSAVPDDVPGATAYARDVARICRVEELAGSDPGTNPVLATAQYLAANLESQQGRDLSIKVNSIPTAERAALLDAAAAEVGLTTGCPTARRWDGK
jgi:hypothetical protein